MGAVSLSLGQNSAATKTLVRAGVVYPSSQLTNGGTGVPYSPTPHVFFNLDRRKNLRPANWDIVNPRSQTNLSASTQAQWAAIHTRFSVAGGVPNTNSRIAKNNAAYWNVSLSRSSIDELSEYDILALSVSGTLSMSPSEREKLRRYVDQGGILWLSQESTGGTVDFDRVNPSPVSFSFLGAYSGATQGDFTSPLLTTPNALSPNELQLLGAGANAFRPVTAGDLGANLSGVNEWIPSDSDKIRAIAGTSATNQIIGLSQIGEGYVVITTCNLGYYMNRGYTTSGAFDSNLGYAGRTPANDVYAAMASKLVVNMINLRSSFPGSGGGSRQSGSTSVSVSAPPIERFKVNGTAQQNIAIYKNRMIVLAGGNLSVYDANPGQDLDNDGNADDGVADAQQGGADLLWRVAVGTGTSGPACGEATGATDPDRIFFVTSTGTLVCYPLNPANVNAPVALGTITAPGQSDAAGPHFTPTIHDGLVFVTERTTIPQANGRVWAVDLETLAPPNRGTAPAGKGNFAVDRAFRLTSPSGPATVGLIPIADNSGGVDRVAYVPTSPSPALRKPAGIASLWVGTRGEKPPAIIGLPGGGTGFININTRASEQGVPIFAGGGSLGVKITLIEISTGRVFNEAQTAAAIRMNRINLGTPGVIRAEILNGTTPSGQPIVIDGVSNVVPPTTTVRVDYSIDWGATNVGSGEDVGQPENYIRGDVQLADANTFTRSIMGGVTMGANGNLFVTLGSKDPALRRGGSFYCITEEGRGSFIVRYRWELHDSIGNGGSDRVLPMPLVGGNENLRYDASVVDHDGVLDFPGLGTILDRPLSNLQFETAPVVRGDTVFVTATGAKKGLPSFPGLPPYMSVVLAFNANPEPASITLDIGSPSNLQLVQPDLIRTDWTATFAQMNSLAQGQFGQEKLDPDVLTSPTRIEVKNFSTSTRGSLANTLACNLPIYVRTGSSRDLKVEPEATVGDGTYLPGNAGGTWNPLRWYVVLNGMYTQTSPVITGNTMYTGGPSFLPNIIINQTFPPSGVDGLMYAMDTKVSPSDLLTPDASRNGHNAGTPVRTWYRYLTTVKVNAGNVSQPPYFKWPQFFGITSFNDFGQRLLQAVLPGEDSIPTLAAGDDLIAINSTSGVYGFRRGDFILADQGRVLRVDSTGNALWSTEFTAQAGGEVPEASQAKARKLNRPWRVYPAGGGANWVVDSGADRIVRLSSGGYEERALTTVRIDPRFQPPGLGDNPPTKLRMPRDMVTFTSTVLAANNRFTNPQPTEFWRHYLIADQGNYRIIELVDRFAYDPVRNQVGNVINYVDSITGTTEPALGVVFGHSSPELSGKQYAYNSISRLRSQDGLRTFYAFGFGNIEPGLNSFGATTGATSAIDQKSGNGGIVIYDPSTNTENLITEYSLSPITGQMWNPITNSWAAGPGVSERKKFAGLSSVTLSYDAGGVIRVMATDSTGIYEMTTTGIVNWALPTNAYRAMRRTLANVVTSENPNGFRPTFARRLSNGDVLAVNAYQGEYFLDTTNKTFDGEVLLLRGGDFGWANDNLGFGRYTIRFALPPLNGVRGLTVPVFADQR